MYFWRYIHKNVQGQFIKKVKIFKSTRSFAFLLPIVLSAAFFLSYFTRIATNLSRIQLTTHAESNYHEFPSVFDVSVFEKHGSVLRKERRQIHSPLSSSVISTQFFTTGIYVCGPEFKGPYIPALRASVKSYGDNRVVDSSLDTVRSNSSLTIQVSKYSDLSDEAYIREVHQLIKMFEAIVVVPTVSSLTAQLKERLDLFGTFLTAVSNISCIIADPLNIDEALYLLSCASNLLARGKQLGALAALSNQAGIVHTSNDLNLYESNNIFKWTVRSVDRFPSSDAKVKSVRETLSAMGQVIPTCCDFEAYGKGDDEKIVCNNARGLRSSDCWVLSLGCNNRWGFEESIVARTNCKVHVFDCSGDFEVPKALKTRVTFHKICVGPKSEIKSLSKRKRKYISFHEMILVGSSLSGHTSPVAPNIAKVDVEGWEVPGLSGFISDISVRHLLPHQILMEVHALAKQIFISIPPDLRVEGGRYRTAKNIYSDFFANFRNAGYFLTHRADNPYCWKCSEVNLLLNTHAPLENRT